LKTLAFSSFPAYWPEGTFPLQGISEHKYGKPVKPAGEKANPGTRRPKVDASDHLLLVRQILIWID
jgi:hypothetical protein